MSKEMDLAARIATRLVERHSDVLLGVHTRPRLDGHKVVFADFEFAVDALARDIREVIADGHQVEVPIRFLGTGRKWESEKVSGGEGKLVSGLASAATGRKG